MSFEIVDGMTGTKHISSDDLSALNVATIGKADCVLKYGDDFKLTMASANSATLGTGVGMVGGKRFWNQAATSLTIQSGTQGQKRNDLVVARYAKTSAGIESITPVVIKGTPTTGTAADPEVTANDLKLWRVPLDGISVGEPVKLFEPVASLATIGDSVSPRVLSSKRILSGGSVDVPTLGDWLVVGVFVSMSATNDNSDKEVMIPCYVGDKFVSGVSGCAVGSSSRYAAVRMLVSGTTIKYDSCVLQDIYSGNMLVGRGINGIVGLIRR